MLKITDLSVTYGGMITAVRNASLDVADGSVVALLGANGAGKTTMLRAISRNLTRHHARITTGSIVFDGQDLASKSMSKTVAAGVVQVPEGRRIFGRLSVEENLRLGGMGSSRKKARQTQAYVYELFPRLAERRKQHGLLLSGGEQQMLAIGRALMASPRLLMLDEPSLGLAPKLVAQVADVVKAINGEGTSVLIIEQNAKMALSISNYAYVFDLGRVSLAGTPDELAETEQLRHLYLGNGQRMEGESEMNVALDHKSLARWKA